jgi:hypothetical protein
MVVPLQWPCFVEYPSDKTEHMKIHIQELKRTAFAMGANLIILTSFNEGSYNHTIVANGTGGSSTEIEELKEVVAFAIKAN